MAKTKAAAGLRARPPGSWLWLQGLLCGAVITFATPSALLLGVMLAPAVLAFLVDCEPGRPTARAVALAGGVFILKPLWTLWLAGDVMGPAIVLISNPVSLGLAWLAGACGWAMCQTLPVALLAASEARAKARVSQLQAELRANISEWED